MTIIKYLLSYIPTALPLGIAEFEVWANSVIELLPSGMVNVPTDDLKFVLASAIQHLGSTDNRVAKQYFIRLAHKAAASQVAGQVFMNIKQKQLDKQLEKQQAEATALTEQVANAQTQKDAQAGS